MRKRQIKQLPFQFKEGEAYLQKIAAEFGESAQIISEPVQISGRGENSKAVYQVIIAVDAQQVSPGQIAAAERAALLGEPLRQPDASVPGGSEGPISLKGAEIPKFSEGEWQSPAQAKAQPAAKSRSFAASAYEKSDAVSIEFSPEARALAAASDKKPMIDLSVYGKARLSSEETLALAKQYEAKRHSAQSANSDALLKEVAKLRAQIDSLAEMRWGELSGARQELEIPKEFAAIYNRAKASGMAHEHLSAIMLATKKNLPRAMYANTGAIKKYFHNFLASLLPCRVDAPIRKQKIMMLIGPTGVGKTTTLAKLAYKYRYCEPRYKVALISLDDFRLGAKEQLAEYASLMRIPLRYISNTEDFSAAIDELAGYDVVLIDSTGNSQYDAKKIAKLEGYLSASKKVIEATLVLSAGMKLEDMLEAYAAFDELRIDSLIFTKFDESKSFGNIFSLLYEKKKPVSFFSIGQNVPDDIMSANKQFLASCLLDGFTKEQNANASR